MKTCKRCNLEKHEEQFSNGHLKCKECRNEIRRLERASKYPPDERTNIGCTRCKQTKERANFEKNGRVLKTCQRCRNKDSKREPEQATSYSEMTPKYLRELCKARSHCYISYMNKSEMVELLTWQDQGQNINRHPAAYNRKLEYSRKWRKNNPQKAYGGQKYLSDWISTSLKPISPVPDVVV